MIYAKYAGIYLYNVLIGIHVAISPNKPDDQDDHNVEVWRSLFESNLDII